MYDDCDISHNRRGQTYTHYSNLKAVHIYYSFLFVFCLAFPEGVKVTAMERLAQQEARGGRRGGRRLRPTARM